MDCNTATDWIEPVAAGEIALSRDLEAHLEVCPRCAADLVVARQVHQWLVNARAQAPRHLTASILQRLPARLPDVGDGLEVWFDTMTALSLVPVLVGLWLLGDPAALRQWIDTIGSAVAGVSGLLLQPPQVQTAVAAIAVIGLMAFLRSGLFDEV